MHACMHTHIHTYIQSVKPLVIQVKTLKPIYRFLRIQAKTLKPLYQFLGSTALNRSDEIRFD